MDVEESWGMLANGCCGAIDIDLNEGLHAEDLYELVIDRQPGWYLRFRLRGLSALAEIVSFLGSPFEQTRGQELGLGNLGHGAVSVVRGSKCDKSWKVVIAEPETGIFKIRLDPSDAEDLLGALKDLVADLEA
jgi:hypothetical protein